MKATPVTDAFVPTQHGKNPGGEWYLSLNCPDYYAYRKLPQAVVFGGRTYGVTGWNSDIKLAYYRTDAPVARKVM
jgi:hypothetical protein